MSDAIRGDKNSHLFYRHAEDWYVEPEWVSYRLFEEYDFSGGVYDPACGRGQIFRSAARAGLEFYGSDIAIRSLTCIGNFDFLARQQMPPGLRHVVSNPPFELIEQFALHALSLVEDGAKVALIFPTRRLNAAGKWMRKTPLRRILYLTPRPSMPPGEVVEGLEREGKKPEGGKQDFCWALWENGWNGSWTGDWLHRDEGRQTKDEEPR